MYKCLLILSQFNYYTPLVCNKVWRTFDHLHLPLGGDFDQLFCPRGGEFAVISFTNMSKSLPNAQPLPRSGLPLIGALIWYCALWKSLDKISTDCTLIDLPIWSASNKATNLLKLQAVSHSICSNIPIQTSFALHLCQYQSNYHFH